MDKNVDSCQIQTIVEVYKAKQQAGENEMKNKPMLNTFNIISQNRL